MITPSFEQVWPDVERRLRALLYRRGLDQPSADDVVQEVALRVLTNGVTYESAGDLLRWAAPVACRLHVDLLRHRARMTDENEASEHAARDDVAGEVADRLELQRALRAIAALRPADRAAIIEAVADTSVPRSRQEAVRLAVRRHRARSRLAVVLEQLAGWLAGAAAGARWLRVRRGAAVAVVPAAAALPLIVSFAPVTPVSPAPPRVPALSAPAARPVAPVVGIVRVAAPAAAPDAARGAAAQPGRSARGDGDVPQPVPTKEVDVEGPGGVGIRAGQKPMSSDSRTLCVGNIPTVQNLCIL